MSNQQHEQSPNHKGSHLHNSNVVEVCRQIDLNSINLEKDQTEAAWGFEEINPSLVKKNRIFGAVLIIEQVAIGVVYGLLVRCEAEVNYQNNGQFTPIFTTFASYFLLLLGFGAIFAYNFRLVWSGIGFTLLITCMTVQWYFLINAFWTKVNIGHQGTQFSSATAIWYIYLTNNQIVRQSGQLIFSTYRATIADAIKCSIANSIIFSAILGRAGPLQASIIALLGTFGYQLNRYVVGILGYDYGFSSQIFLFAGAASVIAGLLLSRKQKQDNTTQKYDLYTGSATSVAIALFGAIIIWIFYPILVMDPPTQYPVETHSLYVIPQVIYYAVSSALLTNISITLIVKQKLHVRNIILTIIGASIASASSGFYITQPVFAQVIGVTTGLVQFAIGIIEKKHSSSKKIISTISWLTFVANGVLGCVWDSIFSRVIYDNEYRRRGFSYEIPNIQPVMGFTMGMVSLGIGLLTGLVIGLIILPMQRHKRGDHFDDYAYWKIHDGINYGIQKGSQQSSSSSSDNDYQVREGKGIKSTFAYI